MKPPDRYLERASLVKKFKRGGCVEHHYLTFTDSGQQRLYICTRRDGRGCETWKVWRRRG